ncbi:hypothetical protein GCM10010317_046230 [Streptomyces mirabilis]|nr:hypothetical protein GCM10010317_046230 [Streptomyces mirabilis]
MQGSLAHNVWFLLGPCEDVCGTASYGAAPAPLGVAGRPTGGRHTFYAFVGFVHLRFPASYTTLQKAQKDPGATLPESSAQQNSPHELRSGRSSDGIFRSSTP